MCVRMRSGRVLLKVEAMFILVDGGSYFPLAVLGLKPIARSGLSVPSCERKMVLHLREIRLWCIAWMRQLAQRAVQRPRAATSRSNGGLQFPFMCADPLASPNIGYLWVA
eukprot:Gb_03371 [translate_table: standard]